MEVSQRFGVASSVPIGGLFQFGKALDLPDLWARRVRRHSVKSVKFESGGQFSGDFFKNYHQRPERLP
jgi:hypothetical protein